MAHSLEIRTPLVDIDVLEALAPAIPHFAGMLGKRALGVAPSIPLPEIVTARQKTGFGVPIGSWIAGATTTTARQKGAASRLWSEEVMHRSQGAAQRETTSRSDVPDQPAERMRPPKLVDAARMGLASSAPANGDRA
jgi:hypothetical protein